MILGLLAFICYRRYKQGNWMTALLGTIGILAAVYIGLGLMLLLMQGKMLYQPSRTIFSTPKDLGLEFESFFIDIDKHQKINCWYVPAGEGKGRWTVLFCHGNAGNMSHRVGTLGLFHELGLNCLIVDYRGYGQSIGRPSEQGTLEDMKLAWDWLTEVKQCAADEIIIFGRSLGGSIAAMTAADVNPAAVVLESTFTSFDDIGAHYYPWMPVKLFSRYNYNTLAATQKLSCPVFIAHSPEDEIVPYKFGRLLYEAAGEPKLFRDLKGDHNNGTFDYEDAYRKVWQDWIDYLKENAEKAQAASA
jgi:fermentation-respiration switch protein FrsA (DUF1100 family)